MKVDQCLNLPCGAILPNRIMKSAMSENMAKPMFYPGLEFYKAYRTWIQGGVGLCVSGNVMVDSRHRGEVNNVVIEKGLENKKQLAEWAKASDGSTSHIWIQLNHPGKQTPKFLTKNPVGPSAIPLSPPLDKMFNTPSALTEEQIFEIIDRFGYAAKTVKDCGFDGVQIHGAHGYLVSQFLSPVHNIREDRWGGSLENRMRFVAEVYKKIRETVGPQFPVGIKINSADFVRGGFTNQEAVFVAKSLSSLGMDLIELSGGSYEAPVMTGASIKASTQEREAYFLNYAEEVKKAIMCPLVVTGGFRTAGFIETALKEGSLDMVGLGRALCLNPQFPKQMFAGEKVVSEVRPLSSGLKFIDKIFPLEIIWYTMQIHRMGKGKAPKSNVSVYGTIFKSIIEIGTQSLKRVRS